MMEVAVDIRVVETVASFAAVVALCILLKSKGIVTEEHQSVFARLLTQAALPAVIFSQLATHPVEPRQYLMVLTIIVAALVSMAASWALGKFLRIDRPHIGALMLTSSFGSSALMGYPVIQYVFPNNPRALADAVFMSEVGVGLPIFILGPLIAMKFGEAPEEGAPRRKVMVDYFCSPIFVAVIVGIAASQFPGLQQIPWLAPFWEALHMIEGSLATLACMVLALQLKISSLRGTFWSLLIGSALIQMVLQPWVAQLQAGWYDLSAVQTQVAILITTMPSAVLGTVFAARYRCAGSTASALVMSHILLSIAIIPLSFALLSR
ncbi:MAG: AEC family transporter [Geobacteraceae bacterium]|nr:AEC family transporter [Geobacteraceae bacterium]